MTESGRDAVPGGREAADAPAGGPRLFVAPHAWDKSVLGVEANISALLNWDYGKRDGRMWHLYERSKTSQWNASTDIDWSAEVRFGSPLAAGASGGAAPFATRPGSPVPAELWDRFRWEYQAWMVSQFLHGEQGALLTTARLVEIVPDMEAKTYAAAQVADEARHVEAYARYIDEKLGVCYPINSSLRTLLCELLSESRWDVVYLGMQVVVEGLALAAFRVSSSFGDPVINSITKAIARDEARHVSFGVIALTDLYQQMSSAERADREAFLLEAIHQMSQRFMLHEIWESMGLNVKEGVHFARTDPLMIGFRQLLFYKVIQILRQINMLTPKIVDMLRDNSLIRPGAFQETN
jgi:Long-chain fatty aldehyde decarbonylase